MKIRWPFVGTSEYEKLREEYLKLSKEHSNLSLEHYRLKRELKETNEIVQEIMPKLRTITAYRPMREPHRFRLQVDFNPEWIREVAIWGNSQDLIKYIAQQLAHSIEREFLTINFTRFRDDTESDQASRRPVTGADGPHGPPAG